MSAIAAAKPNSPAPKTANPIQIMIVDDSAVVRGMISRWVDAEPDIQISASCMNGRIAVDAVERVKPQVIVLDIEMPEMDGLTALPLLLKRCPSTKVIIASTLSLRNAEISLKALALGATETVAKPSSVAVPDAGDAFRRELFAKIRVLGGQSGFAKSSAKDGVGAGTARITLRAASTARPKILCIGSSTGGPQALNKVFDGLKGQLGVPILVTQHMPPTFTAILAQHLARAADRKAVEAENGQTLENDVVYVAPGDKHLTIVRNGARFVVKLTDDPPENFCRPAVDPMLRSAAAAFGMETLAVILTGMGSDGRNGARAIADTGGTTIVQDEATSVVWGMPGAVAQAGLASKIFPLSLAAREILSFFPGANK
jgi:two-component system chemotaxis response regulator CheB